MCVCVCVRACVRECVCACVGSIFKSTLTIIVFTHQNMPKLILKLILQNSIGDPTPRSVRDTQRPVVSVAVGEDTFG